MQNAFRYNKNVVELLKRGKVLYKMLHDEKLEFFQSFTHAIEML